MTIKCSIVNGVPVVRVVIVEGGKIRIPPSAIDAIIQS